jgi:hypothetical protein
MYVKWKLLLVHLEIVLLSAQDRCTVCTERTIGSEIILTHPMVLLGDMGQVEACFGPFGNCVRCKIGARSECTMGMEIILDTPDGTPTSCRSSGSSFWSVWR